MADCECLPACPFFNGKMADADGVRAMYKRRYCQGDNSQCARYVVMKKLGKPAVPPDLYPNMLDRAKRLIGA